MENQENPSAATSERWRKDPNNWIWGIFYYNKEDGRIFPPKRIAWMGFTLNFANPKSVFFSIAFIAFLIYIAFLATQNH